MNKLSNENGWSSLITPTTLNNRPNMRQSHFSYRYRQLPLRQRGWTFYGLTVVIVALMFISYVVMRIFPLYYDNQSVKDAMRVSLTNISTQNLTRAAVVRKFDQQLNLNRGRDALNSRTDLKVKRSGDTIIVETIYRREVPLFHNLGLVIDFHNVEKKSLTDNF